MRATPESSGNKEVRYILIESVHCEYTEGRGNGIGHGPFYGINPKKGDGLRYGNENGGGKGLGEDHGFGYGYGYGYCTGDGCRVEADDD